MTLSAADLVALKRFCQEIIDKPRPIDAQPHAAEGVFRWCEDWELIEITKYLFLGRELYYGDPPPNRLKHNPLWTKDVIAAAAEQLLATHPSAESIIGALRSRRNGAPRLSGHV